MAFSSDPYFPLEIFYYASYTILINNSLLESLEYIKKHINTIFD